MNNAPPLAVCFYCADQNPHRDRSLGITSYTRGLLTHLQRVPELSLTAVTSTSSFALPAGVKEERLAFRTDSLATRLVADHLHPLAVRSRVAVWHYPKGFLPAVSRVKAAVVATVHDTILQHYADRYPQSRSRADFAYWVAVAKRSIARADAILTVSEFSRTSILDFCSRHRVQAPPIHVTYQGINFAAPPADGTKGDYVLHLASTLPHKRTRWLVDAWRQLQSVRSDLPRLLMVGTLDDDTAAEVSRMRGVDVHPLATSEELAQVFSGARALLLPSEIEGFGLPAVEAYAAGTAVAYVKGTAVEEVLGAGTSGGFAFDPDSFHAALDEALGMPREAITQKRAELARRFSWQSTADRTVAVYRRLIG
jgi:glycosyltransferase involved in cell wall biosynthesis